jgi:hypothetical protein
MTITVSTGTICLPYVVIDTALAVGASNDKLFSGPDLSVAFESVKASLRQIAAAWGGDAVINCDFEIRNYTGGVNVLAFGTVVKTV